LGLVRIRRTFKLNNSSIALCVPAYCAANDLPRLLGSARRQIQAFDEILVYDDASEDQTAEVAARLGARVLRGEKNLGCTWGRKLLAEAARSEWVHFHDADDDLTPHFTSLAKTALLKQPMADVYLFHYDWVDGLTGELLERKKFDRQKAEQDSLQYVLENQINPFCGLYHRIKFLAAGGPDLDPEVRQCEDMAMHCKLAIAGLRFSAQTGDEISILNRRTSGSMSRGQDAHQKAVRAVAKLYEKNYLQLKARPKNAAYLRSIGLKMWEYARFSAWVSDWETLRKNLRLARKCGVPRPTRDSRSFQWLCLVNPFLACWLREMIARSRRKKGIYWY